MDHDQMLHLLKRMRDAGPGVPHEVTAAQSELIALVAKELSQGIAQLSRDIFEAKKAMGERLQEVASALDRSSQSADRQASALVFWTKWYVGATFLILLITAIGVIRSFVK